MLRPTNTTYRFSNRVSVLHEAGSVPLRLLLTIDLRHHAGRKTDIRQLRHHERIELHMLLHELLQTKMYDVADTVCIAPTLYMHAS